MSKITRTPGPWEAYPSRGGYSILTQRGQIPVATVPVADKEGKANAALLATAPELLDALEGALVDDLVNACAPEWVAKSQAVIAKAKGVTP